MHLLMGLHIASSHHRTSVQHPRLTFFLSSLERRSCAIYPDFRTNLTRPVSDPTKSHGPEELAERRSHSTCRQNGRNRRPLQRFERTSQATEAEEAGREIEFPPSTPPLLGLDHRWGRLPLRKESILFQRISSNKGKGWVDSSDWDWND